MAKKTVRILGVHGLGHQQPKWFEDWIEVIQTIYRGHDELKFEFQACNYDPIFEQVDLSPAEIGDAVLKLGWSGLTHLFRRERGLLSDIEATTRWTAGYVVAWVDDKAFQAKTRALFLNQVREFKPDIILAHSLGSLVTYNAISHADAQEAAVAEVLKSAYYVTFGSQIGNPFVLGNLTHGRVQPLAVRQWRHLYNRHDPVFTAPLKGAGATNFEQVLTPFNPGGLQNHSSTSYLGHEQTVSQFWSPYAAAASGAKAYGFASEHTARPRRRAKTPTRKRALLVGINDYINPQDRLEGCVNDVFTMSAVLQECGFAPEDIRTCLDRRATASGILERMEWLVDDMQAGDERVFYYSGHGAQMPVYGPTEEPDRLVETLVPCDFDWSPETSITDEHIYGLYSQLPYDARLMMVFDCCHSGGVHRQGGARARGITPPDDIRHRQLKWDLKTKMWVDREFTRINAGFSTSAKASAEFFGKSGAKLRLGRAGALRAQTSQAEYGRARAKAENDRVGPYLPLIIEACGEDQLSYEYRHGATSYGAFTFCLASLLREEKALSFGKLVELTKARLAELQYNQTPQILGPSEVVDANVPWNTGSGGRGAAGTAGPDGSTPGLSG
jgi:hypothetical protein